MSSILPENGNVIRGLMGKPQATIHTRQPKKEIACPAKIQSLIHQNQGTQRARAAQSTNTSSTVAKGQ